MTYSGVSAGFIGLVLLFYILYIGKSFFIPLIIAMVVWYLIITIGGQYAKIKIKGIGIPKWLSLVLSFVTMGIGLWIFAILINQNINHVIAAAPVYEEKFHRLLDFANNRVNLDELPKLDQIFSKVNITGIITSVAGMLTSVAGYTGMIFVYVLLLFMESHTFYKKLSALFPDSQSYERISSIISDINKDIKTYVALKTFASVLTGTLSYVVLVIMGVDFALFWSVLIFLLNYIPTIGSILGVIFPAVLAFIQFESPSVFIITFALLTGIQFVTGNLLEPKLMGKSLNLSPLVIIIALIFWGNIWGVMGMFLCVPIMVIINIVLSKFARTRPLAIMLSVDGKIK